MRELDEKEIKQIAGGDSGFAGGSGKKVGAKSTKPGDGSGAYDPPDKTGAGPDH